MRIICILSVFAWVAFTLIFQNHHLWISQFVTCPRGWCDFLLFFFFLKEAKLCHWTSFLMLSHFSFSILYSFACPCWVFLGLLTKCKHEMKVFLQFQSKAKQFHWRERRHLLIVYRHSETQQAPLERERKVLAQNWGPE